MFLNVFCINMGVCGHQSRVTTQTDLFPDRLPNIFVVCLHNLPVGKALIRQFQDHDVLSANVQMFHAHLPMEGS